MSTKLNPYLGFRDNAKQAMEFYKSVFGGELTLSTFAEFQASEDPAEQGKIMHGMLVTQERADPDGRRHPEQQEVHAGGQLLGLPQWRRRGRATSLLRGTRGGRHHRDAAREGRGDTLGMCTDKFGVSWLVNINAAQPQGG